MIHVHNTWCICMFYQCHVIIPATMIFLVVMYSSYVINNSHHITKCKLINLDDIHVCIHVKTRWINTYKIDCFLTFVTQSGLILQVFLLENLTRKSPLSETLSTVPILDVAYRDETISPMHQYNLTQEATCSIQC